MSNMLHEDSYASGNGLDEASKQILPPSSSARRVPRRAKATIPGSLFVFCAILLVCFLTLLGLVFVVQKTYVDSSPLVEGGRLEPVWAILLIGTLGWALVNLLWSGQSLRRLSMIGFCNHFAITIGCGLIAIGIQAVMFASSLTKQPLVMDFSQASQTSGAGVSSTASSTVVSKGDPAEGRKVFSTGCLTCHGPTGQGIVNLAPSLAGSQFIKVADDAAVASVIRTGRAVGEPNNKSGKAMPARGGNPFLTEDQISHLVAFVRTIQVGGVSAPGDSATPAIQLARWVLPSATVPRNGVDDKVVSSDSSGGLERVKRHAQRRQSLMQTLTLSLTGIHGLFLLSVVVLSSNLLLPRLLNGTSGKISSMGRLATGGWVISAVAWLLITWFCFWWS